MCMSKVEKQYKRGRTPKPTTIVKRWKFIEYAGPDEYVTLRGGGATDLWQQAVNTEEGYPDSHKNGPDVGFHVYRRKPTHLLRKTNRPDGELVQVEVSGLVAQGRGDGYGHNLQVETYDWMRVPKPSKP